MRDQQLKTWIKKYADAVDRACMESSMHVPLNSVEYWQNKLFTNTMKAILPLSLITTIPGIIFSLSQQLYLLAVLDFVSFLLVLWLAFGRRISITSRKFALIFVTYVVGIYLLI